MASILNILPTAVKSSMLIFQRLLKVGLHADKASNCLIFILVLFLSGCSTPIPNATERLPLANKICSQVPIGVELLAAANTVYAKDGTVYMGGDKKSVLFALKAPKQCGCVVELDDRFITTSSRAQCV